MIQRLPGAFRVSTAAGIYDNILDQVTGVNTPFQSAWTPGATLVDSVSPTQQINQKWSLQSVGINGFLWMGVGPATPVFGKLGKVIAGIFLPTNPIPTTGVTSNIFFYPQLLPPLPDPSLSIDLWNPTADPLPPVMPLTGTVTKQTPVGQFLAVSATLNLSQSVDLAPGEQIGLGIFMLPSLLGGSNGIGSALFLRGAEYVLTYDDGT